MEVGVSIYLMYPAPGVVKPVAAILAGLMGEPGYLIIAPDPIGPAPALFQYGLHDEEWVPLADAKDYLAMTTGPKQAEFYDADHALNAKARLDRDSFLRAELSLRP